jgi:hypothetical protein
MPWLSQNNEVKAVQEAFAYFRAQKVDKLFNGGVLVDAKGLAEFLEHLFVLTKYNAAFPIVYFTNIRAKKVCQ